MRIASFDIGKKNFCFCIEEVDISENDLKDFKQQFKNIKVKYNKDGTLSEDMEIALSDFIQRGRVVLYKNSDITQNCNPHVDLDVETFYNMNDLLDQYKEYWDTCDVFVIEQQMNFGKLKNPMAIKLGNHCFSYFTFVYGRSKKVIEFPAYHKTQILGAPKEAITTKKGNIKYKAVEKRERKKWAVVKAMEILENREEDDILKQLTSARKKDDLADVLLQSIAYRYLWYFEGGV